jgi:hypothetical protein
VLRNRTSAFTALLSALVLTACGGGSIHRNTTSNASAPTSTANTGTRSEGSSGPVPQTQAGTEPPPQIGQQVIATVDGQQITRAMILQWMRERLGELYYEVSTHEAPPNLVAEPANYPACLATLKELTPIPGEGPRQPIPTTSQLQKKCEQIEERFKADALAYLLSSYATIHFAKTHRISVTNAEVEHKLAQSKARKYPAPQAYQQLLTSRLRTNTQELFLLENDLIQEKLETKIKAPGGTKLLEEAVAATPNAQCRPEYIVEGCQHYKPPTTPTTTPVGSVLLEEIARWRPQTSHGFTGQSPG